MLTWRGRRALRGSSASAWRSSALVLPLAIACAAGSYLFYAQHNFPGIHVQPRQTWSFARAALESSSYMKMGPVMSWFTGNIGSTTCTT